jgi:hypothetical protein
MDILAYYLLNLRRLHILIYGVDVKATIAIAEGNCPPSRRKSIPDSRTVAFSFGNQIAEEKVDRIRGREL